jgi:hypothetical protein
MLCCEADFAVFILTGVTLHLCWLVCRANAYMGLLIGGRGHHAPSHSTQYPRATSRPATSSSQPSGWMCGCSNLSWSSPRMFSRENSGPLLCGSAVDGSEDAIATRTVQKRRILTVRLWEDGESNNSRSCESFAQRAGATHITHFSLRHQPFNHVSDIDLFRGPSSG